MNIRSRAMDKRSLVMGVLVGVGLMGGVMVGMGAGPGPGGRDGVPNGCRCGAADDATYRMVVIGDRFAVVLNTENGSGKVVDVQRAGNF
jgi:hypothetical protein